MSTVIASGANLVTSVREFDQITPATQNQAMAAASQVTNKAVLKAKTDTVNVSKEALAMAKRRERSESAKNDTTNPAPTTRKGR